MADLDGDGSDDLISGSFAGIVHWLRGSEEGYLPSTLLEDESERPLALGEAYDRGRGEIIPRLDAAGVTGHLFSAVPVDWDNDGDFDLVLGEQDGRVLLSRNVGTAEIPVFAHKPERIRHGRRSVWVESGHSMPAVGDLDGDGLFDLVAGSDDGAVLYWRNTGKVGEPAFAAPVTLVDDAPTPAEPDRPARRIQPTIADLDGDGKNEVILGEHRTVGKGDERRVHGHVWVIRRK